MSEPGHTRAVRWPIRLRLPLLISALLLISLAAFGGIAYWDIQQAQFQAAGARLQGVAGQLSGMLGQSTQQRLDEAKRLAGHPPLRMLLEGRDDPFTRQAAILDIQTFLAGSPQTLGVEAWSRDGVRVLTLAPKPRPDTTRVVPPVPDRPPAQAGFSSLQTHEGLVYYDVIAEVPAAPVMPPRTAPGAAPAGQPAHRPVTPVSVPTTPVEAPGAAGGHHHEAKPPAGWLVVRRGTSSSGAADAIARLVGGGVSVRFGAKSGGVWTDLSKIVPAPTPLPTPGVVTSFTDEDGTSRLAATATLSNAPWVLWVSMDHRDALAPARAFLTRMIPFGLLVALLGAGLAWVSAGRITGPLADLTSAAEAMTERDLTQRVTVRTGDELGRLGHAFNTMADRVKDSHDRLDARVRERTTELERALATLKDTQEELVRREKLAMLGQLASGVGHELRNPLGVMTNAVYFLEMIQPDAPEDVREYHGLLRAQIGLSEKIVSDLLDFARVKPPRRERVAVTTLLNDQLTRLSLTTGVSVTREIPPDLPSVFVDPIQVGQVVLNLLVNAVQAMEEQGGILTVRASANGHGLIKLDVKDTGPGVKPELQDKIFEALFTTKARGIGLGLSVSRSLAEANGGELSVSSPPGEGATFTLTMPMAETIEHVRLAG